MTDKFWDIVQITMFIVLITIYAIWARRHDPLEQPLEDNEDI